MLSAILFPRIETVDKQSAAVLSLCHRHVASYVREYES